MAQENEKKLIIIAGPTAVGKSAAAVALAKEIGGEIISADSMQVYRGMDIGSAKVTKEEMQGIPHYLIDIIDPSEDYNVVRFQEMAETAYEEIRSHGHIPILCGGTGFYIQAFLYHTDFREEPDAGRHGMYREEYQKLAEQYGNVYLHERLEEVDPVAAAVIPANNVKRVIRALEYFRLHGEPISAHNQAEAEHRGISDYDYRFFVLTDDRAAIYDRINLRVDRMLEAGLVEEVRRLKAAGIRADSTAWKGIGYHELYEWLDGTCTYEEAVEAIKINSRHYAKRQLTWFRREPQAIWIDIRDGDVLNELRKHLF